MVVRFLYTNILALIFLLFHVPIENLAYVQLSGPDEEQTWYSMQEAQENSKRDAKFILVYAEASWCVYCRKMDREIFSNQDFKTDLSRLFYTVKINIDSDEELVFNGDRMTKAQFASKYDLNIPPALLIMNNEGLILTRFEGYIPKTAFESILDTVDKVSGPPKYQK